MTATATAQREMRDIGLSVLTRADVNYFISQSGCIKDERGRMLPDSQYQRILLSTMEYCYKRPTKLHLAHMAPPGLGKSVLTRGFVCHSIGNNPSLKTAVISAELKIAARAVTRCRDIVGRRRFRLIFPDVIPDKTRNRNTPQKQYDYEDDESSSMGWKVNEWYLRVPGSQSVDPTMSADAAIPTGEARRPDILIADDIMSRTVCGSTAIMENQIGAFHETWLNGRLSNNGWCVVTHNCWRSDDLLHQLRSDPRFLSLWVGVNDDNDRLFVRIWNAKSDMPLVEEPGLFDAQEVEPEDGADIEFEIPFPENRLEWSPEFIINRAKAAPAIHRMLFKLQATSSDKMMLPHWSARKQPVEFPAQLIGCPETLDHIPILNPVLANRWLIIGGLDWSSRKRRGKALTFLAKDLESHVIIPIFHSRVKTSPDQPGRMQIVASSLTTVWNCGLHWVLLNAEDNAVQDELNDSLISLGVGEEWTHTIQNFTTGKLQMGQIVWPSGMARFNPDWAQLEREMQNLPREIKTGETPDGPMSFWFALCGFDQVVGSIGSARAYRSSASEAIEGVGF
jgi:hypothetical protein